MVGWKSGWVGTEVVLMRRGILPSSSRSWRVGLVLVLGFFVMGTGQFEDMRLLCLRKRKSV